MSEKFREVDTVVGGEGSGWRFISKMKILLKIIHPLLWWICGLCTVHPLIVNNILVK